MYYTTKEVALLLGYTDETIRKKIRKGEIEAFKVGSKHRISKEEVENYISKMLNGKNVKEEEKEINLDNIMSNKCQK